MIQLTELEHAALVADAKRFVHVAGIAHRNDTLEIQAIIKLLRRDLTYPVKRGPTVEQHRAAIDEHMKRFGNNPVGEPSVSLAVTIGKLRGNLELIADMAEGSRTVNSLPHIAQIAREALK